MELTDDAIERATKPKKLGMCLGWYGQWTVADKDSCLTGWCCHPVDNNGNYVNLWDELIYVYLTLHQCLYIQFFKC